MLRILIADDEKIVREGIKDMITTAFPDLFYFSEAGDGVELVSQVRKENIDLLITDIKMPRQDGLEALKELYLDPEVIEPLTVVISGYSDFEYARSCIELGVKDYLLKPIERKKLAALIRKLLNEFDLEKLQPEEAPDGEALKEREEHYIKEALLFIEEHYAEDINMAVISNHLSLHYNYFSPIFKKFSPKGFKHYLNSYRIRKAKGLLANTDLKVMEIAEQVGYRDVKYFTRKFQEQEGLSPLSFRKDQGEA